MIKKISFFIVLMMISSAAVYSNSKLAGKHKYMEKDGKKIDCKYCHSGDVKIDKKKGQVKDSMFNGVELSKIKSCSGSGCH
jgi:hypothetical protein